MRWVLEVPMAVERRQLVLGIASAVVLLLAAWTFWPSTPAPVTNTTARPRGRVPAAADAPAGSVGAVKLDALNAERTEPDETARNPFRFQPRVVPPPPRPAVVAPPVSDAPARPLAPPGPPPLPPIPLKFLGIVERANGVKWAVLSDGKSSPMYGKDGDIIDGRYAIVKIGTESIEMTYADGRGRQVIRLTGQ
ncbi:MAG TPA: hypothetical protein VNT81_16685 [Vicinamibacterales bacterium]|nr:hypothetical protein [Vicinamibacterales bacterium]